MNIRSKAPKHNTNISYWKSIKCKLIEDIYPGLTREDYNADMVDKEKGILDRLILPEMRKSFE